jgi:hypothetical protein
MAPREHVPDLDDEYGEETDDGHLAGAGSLLSINIRNKRPASDIRPRSLSEKLVDHWTAMNKQKGWVEAADFHTGELAGVWAYCFELEPDRWSKTFRVVRIGRILDGVVGFADAGLDNVQNDITRRTPEIAAMLIDWLRRLASESYEAKEPMSERESFPVRAGNAAYSCTVLPLTNRQFVPVSVVGVIETVEGDPISKGPHR